MGEISKIAWTDGTFNIAWGCTEVGPGCDNCYARELAARFGYGWGDAAPRRYFGDRHWNDPVRWNQKAEKAGKRMKVFCSSMADIFDKTIEQSVRDRLWKLIDDTPWIDWQLCTKRIGNASSMLPARWMGGYRRNIWLGITVVNQEEADRDIGKLLNFRGFSVLWLSVEPQLGGICLSDTVMDKPRYGTQGTIDWVVCGGESGYFGKARDFRLDWARSLRDQCRAAGVAFFMKQLGTNPQPQLGSGGHEVHYKWDEPEYWPEDLRIREFPKQEEMKL